MAVSLKARRRRIQLALSATVAFAFGASSVHCGASNAESSGFGNGGGSTGANTSGAGTGNGTGGMSSAAGLSGPSGAGGEIGIDVVTADYSADQFFQNDPPPMTCDGGGMVAPAPGGTPMCPDDKNLPGCTCSTPGMTAACFTGLRKNRGHGDCKDGMTTCNIQGENGNVWGPCNGEVLPTGTTGKAACDCFSGGTWAIADLSPCFVTDPSTNMIAATESTFLQGTTVQCPTGYTQAPTQDWSTDTLEADCAGTFKLCYTLKAGSAATPLPTDCSIISVCTSGYYSPANSTVTLPPLAGWLAPASSLACQQQFVDSGGYGEMSVSGQSDECETVPEKVFNRVSYCPASCGQPNPPAMCAQCTSNGSGSF